MPRVCSLTFATIVVLGQTACGGAGLPKSGVGAPLVARESYAIGRHVCDGTGEKLVDADRDGFANLRTVDVEDGQGTCAELDLNMDGRIDVTRVFDAQGRPTLEQQDFDYDGQVDQQVRYRDGILAAKELDTNFDGRVDTWMWCEGPRVVRLERDRHHTGRVDIWEIFAHGELASAVYDNNNDGRAERWETYRDGHLVGVHVDGDQDGRPDGRHPRKVEPAGPGFEAIRCIGDTAAPQQAQVGPSRPRANGSLSDGGATPGLGSGG